MNDFKVIFDEFEYVYNPEIGKFVCTFDGDVIDLDTMLVLISHEVKTRNHEVGRSKGRR